MTNIQIKSLKHTSDLLKSVNTYPVYRALIDIMTEYGIDNSIRSKISDKFQTTIDIEIKKVNESISWIDTILSDNKI